MTTRRDTTIPMSSARPCRRVWIGLACSAIGVCVGWSMGGCEVVGAAAEAYRKDSTHEIKAEYEGLEGKSFAVVVAADRGMQAQFPNLLDHITTQMTARLSDPKNVPRAGGFVPAAQVLAYQYDNPGWSARQLTDVAKDLDGVKRLIYIQMTDFTLHEPGNQYEWAGQARGRVAVVETDGTTGEYFAFEREIGVKYPDQGGYGPTEMTQAVVQSELARRFLDRASWLFYHHQEPYYPKY